MSANDLEKRVATLERQHQAYHNVLKLLRNREIALRSFCAALIEALTPEQRRTIGETQSVFLHELLGELPPDLQDSEILEEMLDQLLGNFGEFDPRPGDS